VDKQGIYQLCRLPGTQKQVSDVLIFSLSIFYCGGHGPDNGAIRRLLVKLTACTNEANQQQQIHLNSDNFAAKRN